MASNHENPSSNPARNGPSMVEVTQRAHSQFSFAHTVTNSQIAKNQLNSEFGAQVLSGEMRFLRIRGYPAVTVCRLRPWQTAYEQATRLTEKTTKTDRKV